MLSAPRLLQASHEPHESSATQQENNANAAYVLWSCKSINSALRTSLTNAVSKSARFDLQSKLSVPLNACRHSIYHHLQFRARSSAEKGREKVRRTKQRSSVARHRPKQTCIGVPSPRPCADAEQHSPTRSSGQKQLIQRTSTLRHVSSPHHLGPMGRPSTWQHGRSARRHRRSDQGLRKCSQRPAWFVAAALGCAATHRTFLLMHTRLERSSSGAACSFQPSKWKRPNTKRFPLLDRKRLPRLCCRGAHSTAPQPDTSIAPLSSKYSFRGWPPLQPHVNVCVFPLQPSRAGASGSTASCIKATRS